MKNLLFSALALLIATACTQSTVEQYSELQRAQTAFVNGHFEQSQHICDSLVMGSKFSKLGVSQLCDLSMLLMRLGEKGGNEDVNTAMAARCLSAAFERDSDSTSTIIRQFPPEDRSRTMILTSLEGAYKRLLNPDSILIPADSIPDNEI